MGVVDHEFVGQNLAIKTLPSIVDRRLIDDFNVSDLCWMFYQTLAGLFGFHEADREGERLDDD